MFAAPAYCVQPDANEAVVMAPLCALSRSARVLLMQGAIVDAYSVAAGALALASVEAASLLMSVALLNKMVSVRQVPGDASSSSDSDA